MNCLGSSKLLITLAIAASAIALPTVALASDSVSFQDLNSKDEAELKAALPALMESTIHLATLDEAIRWLMARGSYENAFVEKDKEGQYVIIGKPLRMIESISFKGAKHLPDTQLESLVEVKTGERFDRKKAVASAERIKNYYGEQGYFNTVIELSFEKAKNKNIHLVFEIQENTPCTIQTLIFETLNTDLKSRLDSKFRSYDKQLLTKDRVQSLVRDLEDFLIDKRYLATEIVGPDAKYNADKTEAYLNIEIRDPQKWEFYPEGNKFLSDSDVRKALDLENRDRKNLEPASEGVDRLRRVYLELGFPNVQIESNVVTPEATYLRRVYVKINEGQRVRISKIEIEGRVSRSPRYYEHFILSNSSDLVKSGYYNRAALDTGFKNLITELRNQGYLRARVLSSRVEYNDHKNLAKVYVTLDEGAQTQVRGLDFIGNKFFSSFELAQVTGLHANSPLKLNQFESSLDLLKNFYHQQGFMEMMLLNESEDLIQYNEKGTQARVVFQIYEGPRIRVHSISVEGNSMTKASVILKESDFTLGEILTPQKIDDAVTRLNKMGLFSRVDIRTLEVGTTVNERTLIISVTERDPGVFTFGGGVTNERELTLRGFTGISYNNLWGTARAISARAEIRSNVAKLNYPENEITLGYLEPFLFDTRTRGRVNLTRSEYVFDYRTEESNFTEITVKNRIDLLTERDLTKHTKLTYKAWSLESRKDFERYGRLLPSVNATPGTPAATFDPSLSGPANIMQVAAIGPQLDIDYRDNPFLPTQGSFTRFTVDYSNPNIGSSPGIEFIKTEAAYTYYKRLGSPRWVWANSVRGGFLKNLSEQRDSGVPTDWAFILGGIYTVRGYDIARRDERIPHDSNDGFVLGQANQKLIKDRSDFYLLKSELRYPIYGESFGGVLFYDGGAVHIDRYKFDRPYRDSVGIGLRFNTPVGPAAFDVAWKVHPDPEEAGWRWHFYIGTF